MNRLELEKKKKILEAIYIALANVNLEEENSIYLSKEKIEELKEKVLEKGGKNERVG